MGTIYLLHFDSPYRHAKHYMGFTTNLKRRLEGRGARLIQVITSHGIGFIVARTWKGDRVLEKQLKNRGGLKRICPICKGAKQ